jgi:hypothetical protein
MNTILEWLSGGDLRSDGASSEAAESVLKNENLIFDLGEGLSHPNEIVRGRSMDALEKVARSRPDLVRDLLPAILALLEKDQNMMVRMHGAMLFGHLAIYPDVIPQIFPILMNMLAHEKTFTKSWAITSLCIIARKYPQYHPEITNAIATLANDDSAAIRTKTRYAMEVLVNEKSSFPKGWVKSKKLGIS